MVKAAGGDAPRRVRAPAHGGKWGGVDLGPNGKGKGGPALGTAKCGRKGFPAGAMGGFEVFLGKKTEAADVKRGNGGGGGGIAPGRGGGGDSIFNPHLLVWSGPGGSPVSAGEKAILGLGPGGEKTRSGAPLTRGGRLWAPTGPNQKGERRERGPLGGKKKEKRKKKKRKKGFLVKHCLLNFNWLNLFLEL